MKDTYTGPSSIQRPREFRVVDAVADVESRLKADAFKERPFIGPNSIEAFRTGEMPVGCFLADKAEYTERRLDPSLLYETVTAIMDRAADPEDPLFCEHASAKHPKTYQDVLMAIKSSSSYNLHPVKVSLMIGDEMVDVWRFLLETQMALEREVRVPCPILERYNPDLVARAGNHRC